MVGILHRLKRFIRGLSTGIENGESFIRTQSVRIRGKHVFGFDFDLHNVPTATFSAAAFTTILYPIPWLIFAERSVRFLGIRIDAESAA